MVVAAVAGGFTVGDRGRPEETAWPES